MPLCLLHRLALLKPFCRITKLHPPEYQPASHDATHNKGLPLLFLVALVYPAVGSTKAASWQHRHHCTKTAANALALQGLLQELWQDAWAVLKGVLMLCCLVYLGVTWTLWVFGITNLSQDKPTTSSSSHTYSSAAPAPVSATWQEGKLAAGGKEAAHVGDDGDDVKPTAD